MMMSNQKDSNTRKPVQCSSLSLDQRFSKSKKGSLTSLWSITDNDIKYLVGYDSASSWYWATVNFRPNRILFTSNSLDQSFPTANEIIDGLSNGVFENEKVSRFGQETHDMLSLLFAHLMSVEVEDERKE